MPILEMFTEAVLDIALRRSAQFLIRNARQTRFLNYNLQSQLACYGDETPIDETIPYTEMACFLDKDSWQDTLRLSETFRVEAEAEQFQLASFPPGNLHELQAGAYQAFRNENRVNVVDGAVVRLEGFDYAKRAFRVRKCKYSDGLKSNYALDWKGSTDAAGSSYTLRSTLWHDYKDKLPPLSEKRLSNALGLAVIVWYRTEKNEILPYLPMRADASLVDAVLEKVPGTASKRSAVFAGGYHCTASGEAKWNHQAESFAKLLKQDMCAELLEEVGLSEEDLKWIIPVALCREYLRGGKPQLFFAAFTEVEPKELRAKRRKAIEGQKRQGRQEIVDEAMVVTDTEQMFSLLAEHGTIEVRANMFYALKCIHIAHREKALGRKSVRSGG